MLIGSALLIAFSMVLDGLDGQLARQTGQVSRWGDYLDHTLDRLLDAMWVIAIASRPAWVNDPAMGWAAAWFTILGSYMGTQAQAAAVVEIIAHVQNHPHHCSTCFVESLAYWRRRLFRSFCAFKHLELNLLTAVVILSGLGGIHIFVRFSQARKRSSPHKERPLTQPNHEESGNHKQIRLFVIYRHILTGGATFV